MVHRFGLAAVAAVALALAAGGASEANAASTRPVPLFLAPAGPAIPPTFGGLSTGSFAISDNESPRPTDRVFFSYNYFDDSPFSLRRETVGVEKTFLDGNASIGLRLPFFQSSSDSQVGDLSAIFKYALLNTPDTLLSGGLAVTVPTSSDSDNVYNVQPFIGWQKQFSGFYLQGLHSISVPWNATSTDTVLSNNIAAGFTLYSAPPTQFISGIIPTVELHLDRNLDFPDASQTAMTFGAHFLIYNVATLGAAVVVPMGGPKPFDSEGLLDLNLRF